MADIWRRIMMVGSYVRWRMVCVCKWAEKLSMVVSRAQSEFPELYDLSKEDLSILLRYRRGLIWRIQDSRDVHLAARCGLPRTREQTLVYHLKWTLPQTFTFSINNTVCKWLAAGKVNPCRRLLQSANKNFLSMLDEITKIKLIQAGLAIYLANSNHLFHVSIYARLLAASTDPERFETVIDDNNSLLALAVAYAVNNDALLPVVTRNVTISARDNLTLACRTANTKMLKVFIGDRITWGEMDAVILYTTSRAAYLELLPVLPKEAVWSVLLWPAIGAEGDLEVIKKIIALPYNVKPGMFLSEACANHRLAAITWLVTHGASKCTNCRGKLCLRAYLDTKEPFIKLVAHRDNSAV